MGPTSAVSRRKQAKPQRVDRRELVVGVVDVAQLQPPLDCHVCGHCSNEFFDVADFIAHKKVCQVVPVLNGHQKPVTPPSSDTEGAPIDLSKKNNTPDKINVLRLETALDSFRHQQMLERLYSQVASNSEDQVANTSYLLSPPSSNEANADKAHQCHANGCQQTCTSRGALLWHTVGRHAAQRLLQCDRCGERFGDNVQMQRHKNDCDRPPRPLSRCARSPLDPDESRSSVPTSIHQDFSVLKKCGEHETHMSTGWSTTPPSSVATPALSSLAFLAAGLMKEAPLDLTLSAAAAAAASFPSFVGQIPSFATAPGAATSPSSEPNDSYPTLLGNEDDWESLMEVSNTDEAEKIRQLVGDKALPTTDPNQCLLCRRILSCKSALQMHYRTHTGERPFKCKICQRAFTTKGNLKTHMGVHRAKHPFRNGTTAIQHQCPICQKRFFTAPLLQQHISQHTDQLTKNGMAHAVVGGLTNGGGRLESESSVNGHNESIAIDMVHDNVPQQLMPTLPMPAPAVTTPTTAAASVATQHMHPVISTSEGNGCMQLSPGFPFPHFFAGMPGLPPNFGIPSNQQQLPIMPTSTTCNICFKIFACNSALEIHYRSHTKDRPFKCDECGRGFSTKGNMKQHLLTHKIREMPSSTTEDSSDEGNNNNNNTIMAALGVFKQEQAETVDFEERMNSTIDRQTIRPKSAFTNPDKPLVPPVEPQKQEPSPLESIQKMWAQTEPPPPRQTPVLSKHQCGVCFKHFSSSSALQIHMRTHTGDKPFKCNVCTRAFTTRGNLKVHMGTHVWQNPSRRGRRIFDFATNVGGQSSTSDGGYPDISSPVPSSAGSNSAQMDNSSTPSGPITFTSTTPPAFGGGLRPMGPMSFGLMPPPPIVSSASAAGSMEALMWNMWRTVCSVCQKVCSTPTELEEHLKMHIPTLFRQ